MIVKYLVLSFENLSSERFFKSSLMRFLNLTCPLVFLKIYRKFSSGSYTTASYIWRLRVHCRHWYFFIALIEFDLCSRFRDRGKLSLQSELEVGLFFSLTIAMSSLMEFEPSEDCAKHCFKNEWTLGHTYLLRK